MSPTRKGPFHSPNWKGARQFLSCKVAFLYLQKQRGYTISPTRRDLTWHRMSLKEQFLIIA